MSKANKRFFQEVVRDYFPRWKAGRHWRLRVVPLRGQDGLCDDELREIWICRFAGGDNNDALLIIHEVCHAVAGAGHGGAWQARVVAARGRALKLGNSELASLLDEEVRLYESTPPVRAEQIYGDLRDAMACLPEAGYDALVDAVASRVGLSRVELLRRWKRFPKVYESEMRRRRLGGNR